MAARKAPDKPYRVKAWPDWPTSDPSYSGEFATVEEATEAARLRPEPLIDLYEFEVGMLAVRRMVPYPGQPSYELRDDFRPAPVRIGGEIVFSASECGSRIASRVEVITGAWLGQRGIVARVWHPGAVGVRFPSGAVVPFGPSELKLAGGAS